MKIIDGIVDQSGALVNYRSFIDCDAKVKMFTVNEKDNLINFILVNLDVLSGSASVEDIDRNNLNIKVDLFVPKLPTVPITEADMSYTFIESRPTTTAKGIVGDFFSTINRRDEESLWEYSRIPFIGSCNNKILTNFSEIDFNKLELKFLEKFFLSDLDMDDSKLNFSPIKSYKEFIDNGSYRRNYAFYKFSTIRNSVPLTVVFGVEKVQYNEKEKYPKNWLYVYMKRDR
ncbi:hypothetical protein [Vogesella alkaliphila]|nr:hypothetical protein [Vogesella alkaliphila]